MILKECTVHIVGLGLMGGSLAMALRGKTARITGSDVNPQVEAAALHDNTIDAIGEFSGADLVVLATPPEVIMALLSTLAFKPGLVIVDLGSTKKAICDVMDSLPETVYAVGGHPMCGLAENGYKNALPTLYAGARFVLCETSRTNDLARQLTGQMVAALGAAPLWMDRAEHDHSAAVVSHLPHLMSFALMRLAMKLAEQDNGFFELAAGGFDGATRLARTDESMIAGMFRTNADQLRELAALLRQHLDDLTALLDKPDDLRQELGEIVAARRDYTRHYGERMIT